MIPDFDPDRDGFGFANPLGTQFPGDGFFGRLVSPFLGRGLCFGMVLAAMHGLAGGDSVKLDSRLTGYLSRLHLRQFYPPAVVFVVKYWLTSRGGRPDYALRRLRVIGEENPHILCFGPGMNRNFVRALGNSHAVAPYRVERENGETRVFVYDPNHPKKRDRFVRFDLERGTFEYEGFTSESGFGVTLLPLSVLGAVSPLRGGPTAARPR